MIVPSMLDFLVILGIAIASTFISRLLFKRKVASCWATFGINALDIVALVVCIAPFPTGLEFLLLLVAGAATVLSMILDRLTR